MQTEPLSDCCLHDACSHCDDILPGPWDHMGHPVQRLVQRKGLGRRILLPKPFRLCRPLQSHSLKVHQLEAYESTKRACDSSVQACFVDSYASSWCTLGAHSLSCDGKEACADATAELTGDLFCKELSACRGLNATLGGGEHCVVDNGLDGFDSLVGANINFKGQTSMIAAFCGSIEVTLTKGACLHLNCSSGEPTIEKLDATSTCYCTGSACPTGCNDTVPCLVQELNCCTG